ncbi:MAG TPA: YhjD/YihY/BrkB family envelope integrity protein [Actinomycetota bacterium]|nr:YhjD/YihY/BrkB family envelope integrity protein [Actinomycetota bacterium]HNL50395.1 YhjD/YihY/BrkB family envelope integrity protein [Actinomycetota bacterium]HNO14536.1 YhjD/YihY/BrkB family envelope integrity protein [Actinomycetota bacterium]HUM85718.1 YhjD/YihY/BrkB family envelope integrity protein [Actinomycetota bacterium]
MATDTQVQPVPTGLQPIPGDPVDPPPKHLAPTLAKVDRKGVLAGSAFRAFLRYSHTNTSLLAAGTTYYAFLSLFAILVFVFGLTALIGGERLAQTATDSLNRAFPGLIGGQGISPEQLQQVGQTTSIIGLLVLLFSGSGAMVALSNSLHLIYATPKDPRNFVVARLRLLAWMLLLVPLIGLSFVPSTVISTFADPVMEFLGLQGGFWTYALFGLTAVVSIALNALVVWLILGHLGGVTPGRRPRLVGALIGAVGIEVLKYLLSFIIAWSVGKPQYGAFAAPIAMLLVLYLEVLVLYFAACLTAGIAVATVDTDADRP